MTIDQISELYEQTWVKAIGADMDEVRADKAALAAVASAVWIEAYCHSFDNEADGVSLEDNPYIAAVQS